MGLVVPDGALNNPGLTFLRQWLLRRSRVIASIGLPKETFARNEGVNNPSVIIVQKFTRLELRDAMRNHLVDLSCKGVLVQPENLWQGQSEATPSFYVGGMVRLNWTTRNNEYSTTK